MKITFKSCLFELDFVQNFRLNWQFWFSGPMFCKKGISRLKQNEHHHWILHIPTSLDTRFQLRQTILIFWSKFAQKRCMPVQIFFPYFDPYSWIPHIQINLGTKYQVKSIILNFWTSSTQKECFRSKEEKNEDCHRILHIRISLGFKSEFQQFWFFWSKSPSQKKKNIYIYIYFQLKTYKMNISIKFFIFK